MNLICSLKKHSCNQTDTDQWRHSYELHDVEGAKLVLTEETDTNIPRLTFEDTITVTIIPARKQTKLEAS